MFAHSTSSWLAPAAMTKECVRVAPGHPSAGSGTTVAELVEPRLVNSLNHRAGKAGQQDYKLQMAVFAF